MKIIPILFAYRKNFPEKCNKTLSKLYKHLVKQKMQQKVHNIYDVFFIRHIWFQLNSGCTPLKCSIFFLAFISQFKVYCGTYCALCCAVVKQHFITTHNIALVNVDLKMQHYFDTPLELC